MTNLNHKFHHIGLATKTPSKIRKFFNNLGYTCSESVYDPIQNVELYICTHLKCPCIEVISKGSNGLSSPIDNILKVNSERCYHLCYTTSDRKNTLKEFKKDYDIICISPPKKAILFNNRQVSFYYIKDFGVIEILEE